MKSLLNDEELDTIFEDRLIMMAYFDYKLYTKYGLIGLKIAVETADEWNRCRRGEVPKNIESQLFSITEISLPKLLVELGFAQSTSQARQQIKQGGVRIRQDKTVITDVNYIVKIENNLIVRCGKKNIKKIVVSP